MGQSASSTGQGKARRRLCCVLASYRSSKQRGAPLAHCKHFTQRFEIWLTVSLGLTYLTATTTIFKAFSLSLATSDSSVAGYSSLLAAACERFIYG